VRRSRAAATHLASIGVEPRIGDLRSDAGKLISRDTRVVIACQSADGHDVEAYRAAYVETTAAMLRAVSALPLSRFVYVGSTGVLGRDDGGDVDEAGPPVPASPTGQVLLEAERVVLDAAGGGLPACIVRPSGLYGPGRYGIVDRVRSGRLGLGPGDDAWMNFCHREDAVRAVLGAVDRGRTGAIYHASDAEPARRREVITWIARRLGLPAPQAPPHDTPPRRGSNRRVLSARTRRELAFRLAFPSFREGLAVSPRSVWEPALP